MPASRFSPSSRCWSPWRGAATASRVVIIDIIAINALWVAASFGLLVSGAVTPTLLGYAFVIAQALAVALLAELQFVGFRRTTASA